MSFGSSSFGSAPLGGIANTANEQVIFPIISENYAPDVLHQRIVQFSGAEPYYQVIIRQGSENPSGPNGAEYEIYTSHGAGETPQRQVILGGAGISTIGAAPIIIVTALIDSAIWVSGLNFSIVGRPYTP